MEATTRVQHTDTRPAPEIAEWEEKFKRLTAEDPELRAHGKFYTCSFLLDMQEHRFIVKTHKGVIDEIVVDPGDLDERYQFALRASAETWRKMAAPVPEPMYHGLWAASFRRDLKLEGDILVMMQHLRTFTRHLELLRESGVPVGGRKV